VTIHVEHPFMEPESTRDAARRFRARTGGVVSLWTSGSGDDRAGLPISSYLVANGEPARILALVDPDADLADALRETGRAVVQLLRWEHHQLADAFAGVVPAPGGAFRQAEFVDTEFGPRLADATTWADVTLEKVEEVGWSMLATCVIEAIMVGVEPEPLIHRRGRYVPPF
jgi:flavin reductase (DIM6/NTAB) family NADH-FMN oxidoreductase RutF